MATTRHLLCVGMAQYATVTPGDMGALAMNVDDASLREVFTVIALWKLMDKVGFEDAYVSGPVVACAAVNVGRICVDELNKLKQTTQSGKEVKA